MEFIADEKMVTSVTIKQPIAQHAVGLGLTAVLFWGENQHGLEKVQ